MIREPLVAGRFYEANPDKLRAQIKNHISKAQHLLSGSERNYENIRAVIAPHAGYVFSGTVAASAFMPLKGLAMKKNIFILGASHVTSNKGASLAKHKSFKTPLGKLDLNEKITSLLLENSVFNFNNFAHEQEHSLEVMLPFLQYLWGNDFQLVPISITTKDFGECEQIADALLPWFNNENLFVISTDLSHYSSYSDATETDTKTIEALQTGNANKLLEQVQQNSEKHLDGLSTSMCGLSAVLSFMYLTIQGNYTYSPILYQNSGDNKMYGDKQRVVGYQSLIVTENNSKNV